MNKKMKACFTPHIYMHSLFGLGLGILLTVLVPSLSNLVVALVILVAAIVFDSLRKA